MKRTLQSPKGLSSSLPSNTTPRHSSSPGWTTWTKLLMLVMLGFCFVSGWFLSCAIGPCYKTKLELYRCHAGNVDLDALQHVGLGGLIGLSGSDLKHRGPEADLATARVIENNLGQENARGLELDRHESHVGGEQVNRNEGGSGDGSLHQQLMQDSNVLRSAEARTSENWDQSEDASGPVRTKHEQEGEQEASHQELAKAEEKHESSQESSEQEKAGQQAAVPVLPALPLVAESISAFSSNSSEHKFYGQLHKYKNQYIVGQPDELVFNKIFRYPEPKRNGVFLEMGALDGVLYSNTKFFEDSLGWTGVLIEGSIFNYQKMLLNRQNPNVHKIHSAVCEEPGTVSFVGDGAMGGVDELFSDELKQTRSKRWTDASKQIQKVPCVPLQDLLKPLGIAEIDFWSLDVTNSELNVLKGTDFTQLTIKSILIENSSGCKVPSSRENLCHDLLKEHGYCVAAEWDINSLFVYKEWASYCENPTIFNPETAQHV